MPTAPAPPALPVRFDRRRAGVMVPLFSVRTGSDLGIGEILDLIPLIDWMVPHGLSVLQLLPLNECAPGETSPYQALSGFAIDPIYLSFKASDSAGANLKRDARPGTPDAHGPVKILRNSPTVRYEEIRVLKNRMAQTAFDRFKQDEWERQSERAAAFQTFIDLKSAWIHDYALFRLLKEDYQWTHWNTWPAPYRNREPRALDVLREKNADRILFLQYLQWRIWEQWQRVRRHAVARDVLLMGDLPFLLSADSADVWSDQRDFRLDVSVGAPPDDFSATGQDWGLPCFDWEAMKRNDFKWWRARITEARQYFDLVRLDHVVGFFRVWIIEKDRPPRFEPEDEAAQRERGNAFLNLVIETAGETIPIGEDLGVIPDFVRRRLSELRIAGMKVLRWEKDGGRYREPKDYPFVALATTGTHDTTPLAIWWESASWEDKQGFLEMLGDAGGLSPDSPFDDRLHQDIIARLLDSGAGLVTFPIQDLLGQRERINTPATVGSENWRYRLPLPLSELDIRSPYKERLAAMKQLIDRHHRGIPKP